MLIWAIFLGLFTLFFGLLLVFNPKVLTKMSEGMNKMIREVDTHVMSNRMAVGVAMVLLSVFIFYYAAKLGVR
jgi:hypothetical protein